MTSKMQQTRENPASPPPGSGTLDPLDLFPSVRTFWSGGWVRQYGALMAIGAVLAIAGLTAATGAIHARLYGHDIFFLLDNGWRALCGRRVHVDYSSGWGPLTFLLVAAGLAVSGGSVAAVSYANALAASAAGLWSAWLAVGRSRTMTAVAFACFITLIVAAPFAIGDPPVATSHGMVYNRYGYALLAIILLECFQPVAPNRQARARRSTEPILTGCALGLLLFLKITYFLIALPLLGTSLLFRRERGRRTLGHAIGFIGTAFLFLAYLHFDVLAMFHDLAAVAAARSGSLSFRLRVTDLLFGCIVRVGSLGVLTFLCRRSVCQTVVGESLWRGVGYPVAAVIVVCADAFLNLTNAQVPSFPLTAAFAMLLVLSIEPALKSAGTPKAAWALVLTAGLLAVPMTLLQGVGLAYGFVESRMNSDPPGVLRFESARLHPLVLYDVSPDDIDRLSNGREYVAAVNDGVRLLNAHTRRDEKIANLDMFNPFAYALGREPIRGGIAAAVYRYTLDDLHHPSPLRFFADAAVVMVPKHPASPPLFYDGYYRIYQPTLAREFRIAAETPWWRLYRRTAPAGVRTAAVFGTAGIE